MSFFAGFTTGLAKSIDEQLQKDMKRTQDRIDGMGQYRVTRRRAEMEKKEKDKEELREVLQSLAAFTEGDEDKAIQLYNSAGKTIAGGKDLAAELLANRKAGKDVTAAIEFAEAGAEPGNFTDFISRNITPVSTLPLMDEEMEASGLYKFFKPDVGKAVMQQVEEEAPLPKAPELTTKEARAAQATIDRSGFIAAEAAAETAKERERAAGRYTMEEGRFATAQAQAEQAMRIADSAEARAERLAKEGADQQVIDNARADAAAAREEQRLALAVAAAERDAAAFVTSQELQGVTIEQRRLELKKAKEAPKFSTYEAMLVSADQKIAAIETTPVDQRTNNQLRELETQKRIRQKAIDGINAVAEAESTTTYKPSFSKQSVDSIINNEIKRQLQPVGLVKDIEGQLEYKISGNEVQYFDRMNRALDNVELRVSNIEDEQMANAIQAQRNSLADDAAAYIKKKLGTEGFQAKQAENEEDLLNKIEAGEYKAGDIIQYVDENGVTQNILWTGSTIL
jgi:hypothetical protein